MNFKKLFRFLKFEDKKKFINFLPKSFLDSQVFHILFSHQLHIFIQNRVQILKVMVL
jgi:hypothetical protein